MQTNIQNDTHKNLPINADNEFNVYSQYVDLWCTDVHICTCTATGIHEWKYDVK